MARYTTRDGDVLDAICHAHYGTATGTLEIVLEANPGLSGAATVLARGITIDLPEIETPEVSLTRIFD